MESDLKPYRVLVCDDQPDVLEALRLLLKGQGWQAVTADSPRCLRNRPRRPRPDLTDLTTPRHHLRAGRNGPTSRSGGPGQHRSVVVMTAWGRVDLAVEAMRRGACDFVQARTTTACWPASANRPSRRAARASWRSPPTSSRSSSRANPPPRRSLCRTLHARARSRRRLLRLPQMPGRPSASSSERFGKVSPAVS